MNENEEWFRLHQAWFEKQQLTIQDRQTKIQEQQNRLTSIIALGTVTVAASALLDLIKNSNLDMPTGIIQTIGIIAFSIFIVLVFVVFFKRDVNI